MTMHSSAPPICATAALCLALASGPSNAASRIEWQGGRSYMDHAAAPTVFLEGTFAERSIGASRFTWTPDVSIGWIDGRDMGRYRAARYGTTDVIWLAAGGVRLRYGMDGDTYHALFFSFQPVLHTGRTQALSSAYEFASTLGWQGRAFSIQIRHISNGSLHQPNRGETMALLGARFPP